MEHTKEEVLACISQRQKYESHTRKPRGLGKRNCYTGMFDWIIVKTIKKECHDSESIIKDKKIKRERTDLDCCGVPQVEQLHTEGKGPFVSDK